MQRFFANWSWLDDGVLPSLLSIIRACWIWPWLALIQAATIPTQPGAAISLWWVLLLPMCSFTLARWAVENSPAHPNNQGTANSREAAKTDAGDSRIGQRLLSGVLGLMAIGLVLWWQLYRTEFGLMDAAWMSSAGNSLIHWSAAMFPAVAMIIATSIFLWARGLMDASKSLTHDSVWATFLMGIVMMVLYLIAISAVEPELIQRLIASVLVMLAAGMAALAFSSIKITAGLDRALGFGVRSMDSESGDYPSGRTPNAEAMPVVNRYWFLSVGAAIGLMMALGLLLTLLIAPEVLESILDGLGAVVAFIGRIVAQIVLLLAYVAAILILYLFQLFEPFLRQLMERLNLDPDLLDGLRQEPEATPEAVDAVQQAPVPDEYRWLGLLVFAVITAIAFALVIRRLSNTKIEFLDEERESILSGDLLQEQLSNLWNQLRGRFAKVEPNQPYLPLDGGDTQQRIRAVYQALLQTASQLGQPRMLGLTPVEYEARLVQTTASLDASALIHLQHSEAAVAPDEPNNRSPGPKQATTEAQSLAHFYGAQVAPQLNVITAGYVAARYGHEAPPEAVASAVEAAWEEIQQHMIQTNPQMTA